MHLSSQRYRSQKSDKSGWKCAASPVTLQMPFSRFTGHIICCLVPVQKALIEQFQTGGHGCRRN